MKIKTLDFSEHLMYIKIMKVFEHKGHKILLDDEDYAYLSQYKWNFKNKYASRFFWNKDTKTYKNIYMHRLIMNAPQGKEIDHIDGNTLNNQKKNLRLCSRNENMANQKLRSNNTSGYKGVWYDKKRNKWVARIKYKNKEYFLGRFKTLEEAVNKYNVSALKYFGRFARLNDI